MEELGQVDLREATRDEYLAFMAVFVLSRSYISDTAASRPKFGHTVLVITSRKLPLSKTRDPAGLATSEWNKALRYSLLHCRHKSPTSQQGLLWLKYP